MAANYCSKCGNSVGYGDNFCSNCGKSLNFNIYDYKNPFLSSTKKKCPRCNGTGECKVIDNVPYAAKVLIGAITFGIALIGMSCESTKCEKCKGTGVISD